MQRRRLIINEFRQQIRTDLRLQAARGGVDDSSVDLLRRRLAEVRAEFLGSLGGKA